jgi:hypothetical protein
VEDEHEMDIQQQSDNKHSEEAHGRHDHDANNPDQVRQEANRSDSRHDPGPEGQRNHERENERDQDDDADQQAGNQATGGSSTEVAEKVDIRDMIGHAIDEGANRDDRDRCRDDSCKHCGKPDGEGSHRGRNRLPDRHAGNRIEPDTRRDGELARRGDGDQQETDQLRTGVEPDEYRTVPRKRES